MYKAEEEMMKTEKTTQGKQELKKQRIKMYFLEAAKKIIMEEGAENISVRKVADIAGYSYATIYNYFEDINELLWDVKIVMIKDLIGYIQKKMQGSVYDMNGMKELFRIYTAYYFKNPHVFKFFYFYPLSRPDKKHHEAEIEPNYNDMWQETFKGFVQEGILDEKNIEVVAKILIYAVHGILTLSFSNNGDLTEENVYKDVEKTVDYVLGKKTTA
ncbi:MAG: TetR/AcrR family transcriptional regulator [Clostridia bacterium]|nr:TetR/AcrR family transcriptional regulator [Clostridia bacterium]